MARETVTRRVAAPDSDTMERCANGANDSGDCGTGGSGLRAPAWWVPRETTAS